MRFRRFSYMFGYFLLHFLLQIKSKVIYTYERIDGFAHTTPIHNTCIDAGAANMKRFMFG